MCLCRDLAHWSISNIRHKVDCYFLVIKPVRGVLYSKALATLLAALILFLW